MQSLQCDRLVDPADFFRVQAMQGAVSLDSAAPLVREQFDKFRASKPEPLKPLLAWTYGMEALISQRSGDPAASEELQQQARNLDPYFSRAFGNPHRNLYCPPDQVIHEQGYYLTPF